MKSLTKEKRYDMIDAFNSTSKYSISIIFTLTSWFKEYITLNFNKANASDTEIALLNLNLSIHNDTVSTKI